MIQTETSVDKFCFAEIEWKTNKQTTKGPKPEQRHETAEQKMTRRDGRSRSGAEKGLFVQQDFRFLSILKPLAERTGATSALVASHRAPAVFMMQSSWGTRAAVRGLRTICATRNVPLLPPTSARTCAETSAARPVVRRRLCAGRRGLGRPRS